MNEAAYHAILRRLGVDPPAAPLDRALVARLLGMPMARFAQEGCLLEIRVPWLSETLWFVPTEADAEALVGEGLSRGRIWTARELADLLTISGLTPEHAQIIAQSKAEFGGDVVSVSRRREVLEARL